MDSAVIYWIPAYADDNMNIIKILQFQEALEQGNQH